MGCSTRYSTKTTRTEQTSSPVATARSPPSALTLPSRAHRTHLVSDRSPDRSPWATALALGLFALAAWLAWTSFVADRLGPPAVVPEDLQTIDPLVAEQILTAAAAVDHRRGDPDIRARLCMVYQANGLYSHAKDCYLQIVEKKTDRAREWFLLGRSEERLGDLDAAIDALERAAETSSDYAAIQWQLALWYIDTGRLDAAELRIAEAKRLEPRNEATLIAEARLHLARRQYEQAVALIEDSSVLSGRNAGYARFLLASAYQGLGRPGRALEVTSSEEPVTPSLVDPWQLEVDRLATGLNRRIRVALRMMADGQFSNAEEILVTLIETRPDDRRLKSLLAKCYLSMGRPLASFDILQQAADSEPENATVQIQAALAALQASEIEPTLLQRAGAHAQRAVELAPSDARAHVAMAAVQLARRNYAAAVEAFGRAWELDSRDPSAIVAAAIRLLAEGRTAQAKSLLEMVLRSNPDHARVYATLARVLVAQNDLGGARHRVEQAEAAPIQDATDMDEIRSLIASAPDA